MPRLTPAIGALVVLTAALLLLGGCFENARTHYHNADFAMAAKDYTKALAEYEQVLKMQPGSKMGLLGKARALFELKRYAEAEPLFEEFLVKSEPEQGSYRGERKDAEFYRDRCKEQLGQEVKQDPSHIPPPPMGE